MEVLLEAVLLPEGAMKVTSLEGAVVIQATGRTHTEGIPMGTGTRADCGAHRV